MVLLEWDEYGWLCEVFVLFDEEGEICVYFNCCEYLLILFDGGLCEFFLEDGSYLCCGMYGVLFCCEDGFCIVGLCKDELLLLFLIWVVEDGWVELIE